jgi:HAD superfamily hydrolase (TIGR01509 family)
MIQTVFFDLGNVLADFDWQSAAHKIAENSKMSPGEVYTICTVSPMAMQYETGKISSKIFFERLNEQFGFSGSPEELRGLWSDIFTPVQKHLQILDRIRSKYPVGLISNTNEAHVSGINGKFEFLRWFPEPTYSFVAGFLKPQPEIYRDALQSLREQAEKSLFIDDMQANVSAAQGLGMKVIHLTKEKDLEQELKKLNLNF